MNRPERILVVDDEPDLEVLIRQRFRKPIRANELEFVFAHNGQAALETLAQQPDIEIVFTDINMPVMDGLTLLDRMRGLGRSTKSVVVSAYGDMENIRAAMNLGAFDFLTKPIDLKDLDVTLDRARKEMAGVKEAENARRKLLGIERELAVANDIQQAMLPTAAFSHVSIDLYATMSPAKSVSGDFYDYFFLDEQHLALVIGDVAGKGVPAAILMTLARITTKSVALSVGDPAECISRVNRLIHEERGSSRFVTIFYGVLNLETCTLTYCNAGHNPPYRVGNDGTIQQLPLVGGLVVGVRPHTAYATGTATFQAGDTLVLYSDGVTESMTADMRPYGDGRFEEALLKPASCARETVEDVLQDIRTFTGEAEQSDDITMLAVRIVEKSHA